jgi:xylulokinase
VAASEDHLLAVDLGTSAVKVALVSARGEIADADVEPTSTTTLPDGGVEQSPEHWWLAIAAGARRLVERGAVPPERIVGVNIDAHWSGTVPVDRELRPLMNAIIWMDARGAAQARRITGGWPKVEGYGARRLLTWIRVTGGAPTHSGKDSIAHVLWLREHLPEVARETHLYLEPRDFLNARLTGRAVSSPDTMTLHWLTDNRRLDGVDYHPTLLRWTGVPREQLPNLVPPATVLGPLLEGPAGDLGVPAGIPVVNGMPDVLAGALAAGTIRDFDTHLCIGSSSWLICHVPKKKTDLRHNMASLPSSVPGRYLLVNEQESAGICLDWLREVLLSEGGPDAGIVDRFSAFATMDAMAEDVPPGSGGVLFLPWLNGERSPVDDSLARGGFVNVSLGTTRGHLVRAVLEGVAFNARWLLGSVERFTGRRVERLTMVGGGARSDLWARICADVLDRPVRQVADPVFATARGTALHGFAAMGRIGWQDIPDLVPIARVFEPEPTTRGTFDPMFREFTRMYRANRKAFARMNGRMA